ncbi:four-carbon acid sugar kinase family protein [Cohnella cholangitidis]|uniref:Four-carbon acid sugar kinase family protein n=1 Tax=Cohnella cholangitidis TaxID=2598458 RepID=A0A7G5C0V8_9BACL|nr:four-carbon acid sugar kinase family protein [Cohnella cholangitidis]QMV42842.1 four-carbon acid sugar kinase family protein [Cohnella cholangitidis]
MTEPLPLEQAHSDVGHRAVSVANDRRPSKLLCYYGDDFTGSTDVLESLFRAGVRTALFLEPPSDEQLRGRFASLEAFGVAGIGRSLSPDEAGQELRPIFQTLKKAEAAIIHYKICSTFDSSPEIGNIGTAARIGRETFGGRFIPLLVGVPYLGRYTLFGNHFAAAGGEIHRLDRHPTMSRHPITPMKEADLRKHLAEQSEYRISLIDILALQGEFTDVRERLNLCVSAEQPGIVLFDVLDEERLETAGQLIWEEAERSDGLFVIGSSGIEYALGACWKSEGRVERQPDIPTGVSSVDRLLVVSGSCSPVTEGQIHAALAEGFVGLRVPVEEWINPETAIHARDRLMEDARALLKQGRSVILYSATGPSDSSIAQFRRALVDGGYRADDSSRLLGSILGSLAKSLITETALTRIVIAGGDTSGYVTRELGIYALECVAALTPGGPLCRASSSDPRLDGLELVLKGGQVGGVGFFDQVRRGG